MREEKEGYEGKVVLYWKRVIEVLTEQVEIGIKQENMQLPVAKKETVLHPTAAIFCKRLQNLVRLRLLQSSAALVLCKKYSSASPKALLELIQTSNEFENLRTCFIINAYGTAYFREQRKMGLIQTVRSLLMFLSVETETIEDTRNIYIWGTVSSKYRYGTSQVLDPQDSMQVTASKDLRDGKG